MQFVVSKQNLQKELGFVQGVVEKKNTIPVLSNILIESVGESTIRITGTDLDLEEQLRAGRPAAARAISLRPAWLPPRAKRRRKRRAEKRARSRETCSCERASDRTRARQVLSRSPFVELTPSARRPLAAARGDARARHRRAGKSRAVRRRAE